MHMLIAFAVIFVIVLVVLTLISTWATALGGQQSVSQSDWLSLLGVSALTGLLGALAFGGIWSLFAMMLGG